MIKNKVTVRELINELIDIDNKELYVKLLVSESEDNGLHTHDDYMKSLGIVYEKDYIYLDNLGE